MFWNLSLSESETTRIDLESDSFSRKSLDKIPRNRNVCKIIFGEIRLAFSLRFPLVFFYKVLLFERRMQSPSLQAMWYLHVLGRTHLSRCVSPRQGRQNCTTRPQPAFFRKSGSFSSPLTKWSRNRENIEKHRLSKQNSSESMYRSDLDPVQSFRDKFSGPSRFQNLKLHAFILNLSAFHQNRSTGSRQIFIFVEIFSENPPSISATICLAFVL